jgi:hypothetical protein
MALPRSAAAATSSCDQVMAAPNTGPGARYEGEDHHNASYILPKYLHSTPRKNAFQ